MLLPDETYDHGALAAGHLLSMLRVYDEFLVKYRIRPEFFCRYKEKEALQKRLSKVVEETNKRNAQSAQDASSSNEAVHLQQRLRSLSSELVTLRNRLHVQGSPPATATPAAATITNTSPTSNPTSGTAQPNNNNNNNNNNSSSCNGGQQLSKVGGTCSPAQSHTNIAIGLEGKGTAITPAAGISTAGSNNAVSTRGTTNKGGKGDLPTVDRGNKCGGAVEICGDNVTGGGGKGLSCGLAQQQQGQQQVQQSNQNGLSALLPPCSIKNISNASLPVLLPPDTNGPNTCADSNPFYLHGLGSLDNGTGTLYQRAPLAGADLEDLIHMAGPLTEDAVMRCLHGRFAAGNYYTNVGPILLCVNPYKDVGNPLTLSSTRGLVLSKQLNKIVKEAVRQQSETGYPQAIILSGTSGSGKSHASMLLLRQLFAVAGGGPETDAFKHLAAAFTVLRSLGSAKTSTNSESSRIGQFIEVQVTDGALYRTKIHCYFLDQTRVIHPLPGEKNYHIFYQMLAGLSTEERAKLNLEGCTPSTLKYLQYGDVRQDIPEDSTRFQAWKTCLGILGIPFLDVVRVLAAVMLLGNIQFVDGKSLKVDVKGETELNAVAGLLGVSGSALFRGLTSRTHNARGQLVKSMCDANMSNMTRDCLAKALYCRTVATIVRRANSLKRLGSTLGTLSSDSNESVHNHQAEVASQHASTVGGTTNAGSKSMAALNNAVRHATDGFIGILDMFGFEDPKPSQLEHLCINLCAETMQHFYNTHIFKSSIESCRDEGINCEVEVDYVDNVPCIDLISSLRTGLLSMLDVECSIRGTAESYVAKIRVQHKHNTRLFDPKPLEQRLFGIQHFSGRVVYDASDFLDTNKDVVPDDLVAVFYKHSCNFGFATHLFGSELKALYSVQDVPRGVSFRISPTSHTDLLNGDEPVSTLTQDFHTRLDNLLRTLVHARPHFVRCIRSNSQEAGDKFDRGTVVRQIRSLQILETVNLMAGGYPHRMRFKAFNARYRLLAPFARLQRKDESVTDDCHLILHHVMDAVAKDFTASTSWALGKRHIFLSEGIRQHLEQLRNDTRQRSATLIQATWRGWKCRFRWANIRKEKSSATVKASTGAINRNSSGTRPRPQPIAGTPPPDPNEKCDSKIIQQTCNLFGLDLERPPPVPPSRSYTVTGNTKLSYPQTRLMKMSFPEDGSGEAPVLVKGESVLVVGASHRRGHLIVEHKQCTLHVPFQFLELKPSVNI